MLHKMHKDMKGIKHTLESFKEKYYYKFPNSNIKILEILPKEKVKCKDKYSEYITDFSSLFKNHLPTFTLSTNKKQHFINRAIETHGNKYDYFLVKINKMTDKIAIICKNHGIFYQRASNHIFKQGCVKCRVNNSIINLSSNTKEFIKKANIIHNNKYDYSLVEYKNAKEKVIIICPIHKNFIQQPNGHLNGRGCKLCKNEITSKCNKENPTSWTYTNWEKAAEKSKNFDSFKVYIIKCWDDNEMFYKIGKTYRKIEKRFNCKKNMPYNWKIIKVIKADSKKISELEKDLQKLHKNLKYNPKINFKGDSECFTKLITIKNIKI